jgi:membrane associated rhomboid family serine protease
MGTNRPSHSDEMRPFVIFLLTGGMVTGFVLIGVERYTLGIVVGMAGCISAILSALTSKMLDRM